MSSRFGWKITHETLFVCPVMVCTSHAFVSFMRHSFTCAGRESVRRKRTRSEDSRHFPRDVSGSETLAHHRRQAREGDGTEIPTASIGSTDLHPFQSYTVVGLGFREGHPNTGLPRARQGSPFLGGRTHPQVLRENRPAPQANRETPPWKRQPTTAVTPRCPRHNTVPPRPAPLHHPPGCRT